MKLLKLEFANVNSLAGQWSIDFAHEAFAREGLFAIVGSTGAGKTSILDAISLALYGKTARQEDATNAGLAEVMTHDAKTCWSKVSFCGIDGVKYRAEWEITRKTRRDSDGGVNDPTVKIYELAAERDILLGTDKKDTKKLIVEKVGLNFAQFQRSMMLAQGQFDKFLTASDTERAEILAQAAGTEIFARIGTRIFEKKQAAEQEVDKIRLRQGENIPLSPDERGNLETRQADAANLAEAEGKHLEKLRKELAWHREEEQLNQDKAELMTRKTDLEMRRRNLAPEEQTLSAAERARSLCDEHISLQQARNAKTTAEVEATQIQSETEKAQEEADRQGKAIPALMDSSHAAEDRRQTAAPAIAQASRLDIDIVKACGDAGTAKAKHEGAVDTRNHLVSKMENLTKSLATLKIEQAYLEALHVFPETEVPETVDPKLAECAQKRTNLKSHAAGLIGAEEQAKADLATCEAEFARAQDIYNAEQPQIEARVRNAMRICRVMTAMNYDEVRANLRAGDRCPVCGKPVDDVVAKDLPEASEFDKEYKDAVTAKNDSDAAYNAARGRRDKAEKAAKTAEEKRKRETEELEELEKLLARRETETRTRIQETAERLDTLQQDVANANEVVKTCAASLDTAEGHVARLVEQRKALNLPENLADYKKSLDDAVEAAAKALADGQKNVATANAKRDQLLETLKGAREKADIAASKCSNAETSFARSIGALGFADETVWRAACGDDHILQEIRQRKADLAKDEAALGEAQRKYECAKVQHDAEDEGTRPREDVERDIQETETRRSEAERDLGNCLARIKADDDCRQKGAELAELLKEAQATLNTWKRLNALLGGSGGFRFSQYAQGLTLRRLLEAANPFLSRITGGRYSLLWRPAPPAEDGDGKEQDPKKKRKVTLLLPLIMDHNQHDTVRPISNVSGGERFEVSLALALGLAKLNAGNVKVETMFLDEGFGTLDPERLGAALDVLCELHSEGATIGVISHIKAVEDRLPLKIRVEPAAIGFGRLVGEGAIEQAVCGHSEPPSSSSRKNSRTRKRK